MATISFLAAADMPSVHQSAYKIFCSHRTTPWKFATFQKALCMPNSIVATNNGQCLAYVLVSEVLGEFEIEDICVDQLLRRGNIAFNLLEYVIQSASKKGGDRILLEVAQTNVKAQGLYKKCGFELVCIRKDYYTLPNNTLDDALVMCRQL